MFKQFREVARTLFSGVEATCFSLGGSTLVIEHLGLVAREIVADPRLEVAAVTLGLAAIPTALGVAALAARVTNTCTAPLYLTLPGHNI